MENKLIHNNMKEIDWANLSFGYMKTDYNVRINFRNGAWGELEVSSDEHLNLHMAATCLHYGQEVDSHIVICLHVSEWQIRPVYFFHIVMY